MSKLEEQLLLHIKVSQIIPPVREFRFHPTRKWRSDFAWPDYKLIVEVEGGIFSNGRHTRGVGFQNDCEKYNEATVLGYSVLRVTEKHIKDGRALNWIEKKLKRPEEHSGL